VLLASDAMTDPSTLRADARRNREAVLAAARRAFAERGLQTSLDDIAKQAGVGSGTLYRHFPTRDDLVAAVFTERMAENVALVEEARQQADPWEAFAGYIRATCRAQAADKGLADLFALGHRGKELGAVRARAHAGFVALIDAAKASGDLRDDFTTEDIVLLMMANAGLIERAGSAAAAASDRFVSLALDGFRAKGATPAPAAPSPRTMMAVMRRHGG
jgi:AcrR family transcriptional regulator